MTTVLILISSRFVWVLRTGAYHIAVFVLATEFSGIRHRGIAGALVWLGIPLATIVLSGCAYAIRDWRLLSIVTGAPGILLVAGYL